MLQELMYPFDANSIISGKKRLRRQLLSEDVNYIDKRIAILGGYTTSDIRQAMELFLLNNGIRPTFYESEYCKYYEDAVFDNEVLSDFAPDVVYVCTSNRNILDYPRITDSADEIDRLFESETDKYRNIWESLDRRYHCQIIQNNFEMPIYRLMGNRDSYDIHGRVNYLGRINDYINEYARNNDNFHICDINYISADYGLKQWSDPFYYHMYKYAVAVPAIPYLSHNVAAIIKSIYGKNKKGFVLDLDNTLWGGVIGDDGVDGIVLGPEESEGQAYLELQKYIRDHKDLGITLSIDSKNDYDNAVSGLGHPDSALSVDDFVVIKANWDPKDINLDEIASTLNVLPESLVFIDDNPAERHIVTSRFSDVSAPDIGEISRYIINIDRNSFFETTTLSEDDMRRSKMYSDNIRRENLQKTFTDYGEYLDSLGMTATIRAFESVYMARIAQLTNKSNQFNLTTKRMTQQEIEDIASGEDYITLYGRLVDIFGDNGVVSVVIGHISTPSGIITDALPGVKRVCDIELWLMSCRVLKRDMEYAMMDTLVEKCRDNAIDALVGYYYPTKKNKMVMDFYDKMGYSKVSEDSDGSSVWILDIRGEYESRNSHIEVEG